MVSHSSLKLLCCMLAPALAAGSSFGGSQLRGGERRAQSPNATAGLPSNATAACHTNAFGLMLERMAPSCVQACPALCKGTSPMLLAPGQSEQEIRSAVCTVSADLSCALEATNAQACGPLAEKLTAQWAAMPMTPGALATMCKAVGNETVSALNYYDDPVCKNAPEGQFCVPKPGGHSDSFVYCSAHRRISPQETRCTDRRGEQSWCITDGSGLTASHCDDPFCRNGGAYAGRGEYCHEKAVVYCGGQEEPETVRACVDRTYLSSGELATDHFECVGEHNDARCEFSYHSSIPLPTFGGGGGGGGGDDDDDDDGN